MEVRWRVSSVEVTMNWSLRGLVVLVRTPMLGEGSLEKILGDDGAEEH